MDPVSCLMRDRDAQSDDVEENESHDLKRLHDYWTV